MSIFRQPWLNTSHNLKYPHISFCDDKSLVPARFSCISTTGKVKELEPELGSTLQGGAMKLSTTPKELRSSASAVFCHEMNQKWKVYWHINYRLPAALTQPASNTALKCAMKCSGFGKLNKHQAFSIPALLYIKLGFFLHTCWTRHWQCSSERKLLL